MAKDGTDLARCNDSGVNLTYIASDFPSPPAHPVLKRAICGRSTSTGSTRPKPGISGPRRPHRMIPC
jgi:hypothetical protein